VYVWFVLLVCSCQNIVLDVRQVRNRSHTPRKYVMRQELVIAEADVGAVGEDDPEAEGRL
jgi:hypothetical protein